MEPSRPERAVRVGFVTRRSRASVSGHPRSVRGRRPARSGSRDPPTMVARRSSLAGVGTHSGELAHGTGAVTMDADGTGADSLGVCAMIAPQGASALAEAVPLTESAAGIAWNRSLPLSHSRGPSLSRQSVAVSRCRCVASAAVCDRDTNTRRLSACARRGRRGPGYGAAPHVGRSAAAATVRARSRVPGAPELANGLAGRIRPLKALFCRSGPPRGAGARGGRTRAQRAAGCWACPFTTKLTRQGFLIGKTGV